MQSTVILAHPGDESPEYQCLARDLAPECAGRGWDVVCLPDVYHIPEESAVWVPLREIPGPIVALSCLHPRALEWVLREQGVGNTGLHTLDMRIFKTVDDALEAVCSQLPPPDSGRRGVLREHAEPVSPRWYPVVDKSRCIDCQHCLQFCLFGVWELDETGGVCAAQPDNCKPGCPACARICPQSAIMFPLHEQDPAIAGAPGEFVVMDDEARRMFYVRTETQCPVCGLVGDVGLGEDAEGRECPECGRKTPLGRGPWDGVGEADAADPELSDTFDEIDSLIDELEDMTRGGL